MVHIINKNAGGGDMPLPYEELARLARDAINGDPIAGIRFDSLPRAEQSLAKSIYKAYSKPKKAKAKKKMIVDPFAPIIPPVPVVKSVKPKSAKQQRKELLQADLNSPDPSIREAARAYLNGEL